MNYYILWLDRPANDNELAIVHVRPMSEKNNSPR